MPTPKDKEQKAAPTTMYAQTNIRAGWAEDDGSVTTVEFDEGDEVSGLPEDQMEELIENGALAPTPRVISTEEVGDMLANKDARIAQLEEALKAAKVPVPDVPESEEPVEPEPEPEPAKEGFGR